MKIGIVLIVLTVLFAILSMVFLFRMLLFLVKNGVEVDFLNVRWNLYVYVKEYKIIYTKSVGKLGADYYLYHLFGWLAFISFFSLIAFQLISFNKSRNLSKLMP